MIPFLPTYIPVDVDINQVKADVAGTGVSVPPADAADVPALRQVVEEARKDGIDLKIVVIEHNPPIDTPLRDIATEVGQAQPGLDGAGDQPVVRRNVQSDVRSRDARSGPGCRQDR